VTARFGSEAKSVTISRNGRSRSTEITGHDRPERAVTMGRNTQQAVLANVQVSCMPIERTLRERIGLGCAVGASQLVSRATA
jgi:hypothetical protein